MPDPTPLHSGIWPAIAAAFRQNRLPCVLLNVLVVCLVASYYLWPEVAAVWERVGAFKTQWSYWFSFGSTVFSAALLPFAAQAAMGTLPRDGRLKRFVFAVLFWGYRGMEIDLFYRCQTFLFGGGNDFRTLAIKIAVDQLLYSPFWAVPTYLIALRWLDRGCSWARTRESLDRLFWTRTFPTLMVANWIVWIPAVALVYSLPAPLQFPLFSVIMCFFVLLVTLLARGNAGPNPEVSRGPGGEVC
jgi:hypothetical protein